MNFLLEVTKDQYTQPIIDTLGGSETLAFGLQMVLLGMLAVFSVLLLIMLALYLFQAFFTKSSEKKSTPAPVVAPAPVAAAQQGLSDEVVVAIAAAIAMAEEESDGLKFKVVSFRRK